MFRRFDLALLIGIVASVALTSMGVFARECGEVRDEVLRLHILAHSDSDEDQALKYQVRDRLLEQGAAWFGDGDKAQAVELSARHLRDMETIAAEVIAENGRDNTVRAELVHMYFGTRRYGDTLVAAGWYDAVRITIGEGRGENWWCVMFPPMCLPAAAADGADSPEWERIEELGQPQYIPKFAIVEWVEQARNHFSPQEEGPVQAVTS